MTDVRLLAPTDRAAAHQLGGEAFGMPPAGSVPGEPGPGRHEYGSFDGGVLAGAVTDREFDLWWHGGLVPTAGVANVTVAAEQRGRGVLRPLMTALLRGAYERGAVVSTLFPSAPRIYRGFGYEVVAEMATVTVPSHQLLAVGRAETTTVRRAGVADVPAVRALYDTWAAGRNGTLSRRGVSFPAADEALLAARTGVTVAQDDTGRVVGYAAWDRGAADGSGPALAVSDLLAVTADAYRALVVTMGSFASVAGDVQLRTAGDDPVRLLLPGLDWTVLGSHRYMAMVLDVAGALTRVRPAPGLTAELDFTLAGHVLPDQDGAYRLSVADGRVTCVRGGTSARQLTPRGLALLWSGAESCRTLRFMGLLSGGDEASDPDWDALFGGRRPGVLDYF